MSTHPQLKYQLIFVLCLAVGISLFCTEVDARKRDGSDENSSGENSGRPDWNKKDKGDKFVCPMLFGAFPDPEDCESFYTCVGGIARHKKCPPWRKFDKNRKVCLSIFIAVCEDGNDEKTTKTTKATTVKEEKTTTIKDGKFTCPSIGGSYPHPEDCSKYYKCTFFISSIKTCPDDELFDGVKKECKPANEVHCGSRNRPTTIAPSTKPTTPAPTTTTPAPTTTTPAPTTTTPAPTTTTPAPTTTPEPTTTTPEPTTTTPEPTTTTPEPTTTTPEPTTTTPEPTTTTPEPTTTTPEPTTTLEPTSPQPTGPPETDCEEDDLDCIIKETGEIPDWFKCPDDIGSYRHPSSKKLFIFCINKKPFVKRCGQDLIFSDELKTCVNA